MKPSGRHSALVLLTVTLCFSAAPHAALVDHGSFTTDTVAGLDWLDFSFTLRRSLNDVSANLLQPGQPLAGWRYANFGEIDGFWRHAFGPWVEGWSTVNEQITDVIASHVGYTTPFLFVAGLTNEISDGTLITAYILRAGDPFAPPDTDLVSIGPANGSRVGFGTNQDESCASYLVRASAPVPLPAAVWLFAAGVLALGAMKRTRTKRTAMS